MLGEAKRNIWHNINANVTELWLLIQITLEQQELIYRVKEAIEETKVDIEHRPEEAQKIIRVLNSKNRDELEDLNIQDMTETEMEVKRVLTKKYLIV